MRIIFPELKSNPIAKKASAVFPEIDFIPADSLEQAATMLKNKEADSMISGLDFSSRDVLLTFKKKIPLKSVFFSSCFICEKENKRLAISDGGVNKQPSKEQLYCIAEDTAKTYQTFYHEQPKIAMLSYSTYGSGGKNSELEKIQYVINRIRKYHPDYIIDGEIQLDAAINPIISSKKNPNSPLKGQANILIVPDLNSGNILYKSIEQFAGYTVAGPIIQGFEIPLSDLSRGSTLEDTILTIKVIRSLL